MTDDQITAYKNSQRDSWGLFVPMAIVTTTVAPALVRFSELKLGDTVLDVGCGTGVVAITAARLGAIASGVDLSPQLLESAEKNKCIADVSVDFKEGDVEALPYPDESFDVVLSQFGHMFATNAQLAMNEMLRVLKPGGIIAFSTWPKEHFVGSLFTLVNQYNPPTVAVDSPSEWGSPHIVKNRMGTKVTGLSFDYGSMSFPALSLGHYRQVIEKNLGPVVKFVEQAKNDATLLQRFRDDIDSLAKHYYRDNLIHQSFLMTRAIKMK